MLLDFSLRLFGCRYTPQRLEGVEIERQWVYLALIVGEWRMDKGFELHELIYELPNLSIRGVEDVRAIFMDKDAVALLAVAVSADMSAFINHQNTLTRLMGTMGDDGTIQSGTDNQQIIFWTVSQWPLAFSFFQ